MKRGGSCEKKARRPPCITDLQRSRGTAVWEIELVPDWQSLDSPYPTIKTVTATSIQQALGRFQPPKGYAVRAVKLVCVVGVP